MSNPLEPYQSQWSKIAKASRWLFWGMLIYVLLWWIMDTFHSFLFPMNPHARVSLWGKFRWYAPSFFILLCELITLFFLYFIQSALNKGIARADEKMIQKGLSYLTSLFWVLVFMLLLKLVFEWGIQPHWWSWEF